VPAGAGAFGRSPPASTKLMNDAGNDGLFYGNPAAARRASGRRARSALYAASSRSLACGSSTRRSACACPKEVEREGLDTNLHGEQGYAMT